MRARTFALALLYGCAAMAYPRAAAAFSCSPPRRLTPLAGAVVPSNTLIWDVCYYTAIDGTPWTFQESQLCSPPSLEDSEGKSIDLIVEQQVRSTRYARVLTAYRPSTLLVVGGQYRLDAAESFRSISHEFSVVEPALGLPDPPVVAAVDFSVGDAILSEFGGAFNARFTFEPFEGNLVAESESTLSSPFEGLDISWHDPGKKPVYYLAKESCFVNFDEATWGAPATIRFGILDMAGNFSGWSEPTFIEYPGDVTQYPEPVLARERSYASARQSSACSVAGGPPSKEGFGLLAIFVVAGAVRRARSRS